MASTDASSFFRPIQAMILLPLVLWGVSGCVGAFHLQGDKSDLAELETLVAYQQQQLHELEQEVSKIQNNKSEITEEKENNNEQPEEQLATDKNTQESTDSEEPKQPDFTPKVKLRGRIHADAVGVTQSPHNKETIGDLENATGFRRVRLGAQGTIGKQVYWISAFEFSNAETEITDVFIGIKQLPFLGEVRLGHFREPFSLEAQTSSNYFPLTERSAINVLDPSRNWGMGWYYHSPNKMGTFALGGFRGASDDQGLDVSDDNDWALTCRGTRLLWYEEVTKGRWLMHVGGSFSHREAKDDLVSYRPSGEVQLISREETPLSPFLNPIEIPASANRLYNLEWAWVHDSFTMQAEWIATQIDQIDGPPVFLQGCYVMASYFLTGEHSHYSRTRGAFGKTKILSPFLLLSEKGCCAFGPGAWQVVGRISYLDFDDRGIPKDSEGQLVGDRLYGYTIALNWYLNDNTRLMLDYNYTVLDNPNFGHSVANTYTGRFMLFW